ncbi:PREDICTED: TRAF3-interacting JNK-activating modulator isoform X2 [Chinchilla lanigera]|uniref:TRAF3-interacting JNK-activating modulator isoform X2 n=1 Tax=Chinchilla lanigera TaxID=34839 RepID=UPI00069782FC|nr:PREDICTED: TRAF3-interacting JNK-activating modulator isoform X2 [Chinchilla lanigera]
MISPDPRRSLGVARWAESYEAKCERRQETRESRRCRPNVTTCRQVGRALRTQQREQLRRARQLQFFRRRNLEVEEKGQAQRLRAKEQGHSRRPGQAAVFKESLSSSKRTAPLEQQGLAANMDVFSVQEELYTADYDHHCPPAWLPTLLLFTMLWPPKATPKKEAIRRHRMDRRPRRRAGRVTGTSSEVLSIQCHSPSSVHRDLAERYFSQVEAPPPQDSHITKPPKRHCGTQTKAEDTQPTIKNDASQQTNYGVAVLDKEIIQLSEYLKEALQRELVLKQKMVILQDLLSALIRASDSSWKGQLNEDKLKGKLRSLENQLYACTQKYSPWRMNKVLLEMEDQKNSYEQKAKESLQKVLEEKMGAEQQLQSTQRSLALAEQKCEEWRSQYEALKEAWMTLGAQHREQESQLHVLQSKIQGADSRDAQMNQTLRLLKNEHEELQAKIECLQGEQDLCASNSQDLQDQLKRSEEEKLALEAKVQQLQSLLQNQSLQLQEQEKLLKKDQALPMWTPKPSQEVEPEGTGKNKDWDLKDQLQKKTLQLQAKEQECTELHSELDNLSDEYLSCLHKLQHCREELKHSLQLPPRRHCGRWLPMLMVVIATALAVLLANKDSLMI